MSEAIIFHADRAPLPGVESPGPHQIYRNPRLTLEGRDLGPLQPGMLRIRMVLAGICGTDVHTTQADPETGYIRGSAPLEVGSEGRLIGHEGVGRIEAVGADVAHLRPGMLVTFESIVVCHHCDPCRRGQFNQCASGRLLGMEQDGIFGEVVDVPAQLAHDVSDLAEVEGGLEAAACVEPAACGYVALNLCRVRPGERVLIFGAGPIGLLAAVQARVAFGAGDVQVVEPVAYRRELASRWADVVHDPGDMALDPAKPIDVMIEASGHLENLDSAFPSLGANARVALLARSGRPLSLSRVDHMITNNISIVGSRGHLCGAFPDVLRLIRAQRLPLHEAVTETVSGLAGLKSRLEEPDVIVGSNCKVLARIGA